ncbi:MAG: protein kinase [Actinomycetota bacterium]
MADDELGIDLGIEGIGPAEHIGRGGFADVYRAEQLSLRRPVAVKVLRGQARQPDADARFQRECHAIGAVSDHPHIVAVHHGGLTRNGRAYLVMEYLSGGSLAQRLDRLGVLPVPEVVDTMVKIARALAVAHRAGILHRDVKPGNIMISAYGEPALGDFGIARIEGGHQTTTGLVNASIVHAAPEVLEGHKPTPAADIYSLGSTIFELIVGRAPYYDPADESVWPVMKRILSEPMPAPESIGMSPALGAVFRRATARLPQDRYQDADEMADELAVLLDDHGALALRPPTVAPVSAPAVDQAPTVPVEPVGMAAVPTGGMPPPSQPDLTAVQAVTSVATLPQTQAEPTPVRTAPRRRSAGDVVAALLAVIIAGGAIGAAAWFLLLPALDDDGGGAITGGSLPAVVDGATSGPLVAGVGYAIAVDNAPADATFRLVLDGEPLGDVSSTVPTLATPVGRHRLQVEVVSSDGTDYTDVVDFVGVDDQPDAGFRAHLARIPADPARWGELIAVVDALAADGHEPIEVVASDDVAGVAPGAWLITVPGFVDGEAAEGHCERFELSIPDRCYAADVVPATS